MTNQEIAQMLADHSDGLTVEEIFKLAKAYQHGDDTITDALQALVRLRFADDTVEAMAEARDQILANS